MSEQMTSEEAARRYGVNPRTLRDRLQRDYNNGVNMHGSKKMARLWIVTTDYMENWKDKRLKESE